MTANSTHALPQSFLERLSLIVPSDRLEGVLKAFATRKPTTFRVNTLKTSRERLIAQLSEHGLTVDQVPWYLDAFVLRDSPKQKLLDTPMYARGEIYVQSLSSMLPPMALNPQPGERVGDIAAAPGSKTTQMAALMRNLGEIVANDRSKVRLFKLVANLKMQGVTNVRTSLGEGERLWQRFPEYFDKTLVDVPCSLEGRFDIGNPKSYRDWSVRRVKTLSIHQRHLLRSAISATRPGGLIVYSTCTLSPEENEEVVDWVLEKERSVVQIEPVELPLEVQPGIAQWARKAFPPPIRQTARILPSELMEGFYIAKLRKL